MAFEVRHRSCKAPLFVLLTNMIYIVSTASNKTSSFPPIRVSEPYVMFFSYEVRSLYFDEPKLQLHMWLHLLFYWHNFINYPIPRGNGSETIYDQLPGNINFEDKTKFSIYRHDFLKDGQQRESVSGRLIIPVTLINASSFPNDAAEANITGPSLNVHQNVYCVNGTLPPPYQCGLSTTNFNGWGAWRMSEFRLFWRNHTDLKEVFFRVRLKRSTEFIAMRVATPLTLLGALIALQFLLPINQMERIIINAAVIFSSQVFSEATYRDPLVSGFGAGANILACMSLLLTLNFVLFVWTMIAATVLHLNTLKPHKYMVWILRTCSLLHLANYDPQLSDQRETWLLFAHLIDLFLFIVFGIAATSGISELLG